MATNLTELLADRERGVNFKAKLILHNVVVKTDDGCDPKHTFRRVARLPDLEAAYIEAVELLKEINTHWRIRQSDNFLYRLDQFLGYGE